jgi:hypothetical protein
MTTGIGDMLLDDIDIWEWIRQLLQSIVTDAIYTTVTIGIACVLTTILVWFIRQFITSLRVKSVLLKTLKVLNHPILEEQQFVITIDDARQTLFAQKPHLNTPPIQEFFNDRDVQTILLSQHPFITSQGAILNSQSRQPQDRVFDLHVNYRALIEKTYAGYRHKKTLVVQRTMPSTYDFGEWWTHALIDTIQQQFTMFERTVQRTLNAIAEHNKRMNALDVQISTYFRVVNARQYTPAPSTTVNAFYQGQSILTWEIIAAGAVVARNQRAEFIATYGSALPTQFELICVTGEIGDGKTTFLWDAALEIAQRLQCPLIQCVVSSPEAWGKLAYEIESNQQPAVVLVDDVFKSKEFTDALYAMAQVNMPIRVFATARLYDVPKFDTFPFTQVRLNPPTQQEVDDLVSRYAPTTTNGSRSGLYKAPSWLVLMMELASGNSFENVVLQSLEHLRTQNENHYNAYIYVCFVSQYNIAVPRDLLATIRAEFWNIQIPGYLFDIEASVSASTVSLVRAAHAQIARVVIGHVSGMVNTRTILATYLESANVTNPSHRSMIGMLGVAMIRRKEFNLYADLYQPSQKYIAAWFAQSTHVEVFNQIATILYELNAEKALTILHRKMLDKVPQSTADWRSLLMYANRTTQRLTFQLLLPLKELAKADQQDVGVWDLVVTYLNAHKSNQFVAQQLIPIIADAIGGRSTIRTQYLQLVEKFGSNVQVEAAILKANGWITNPKASPLLVIAYAQLVNQRANREVKQSAVKKLALSVPLDDDFAKVHPGIFHQYMVLLQSLNRETEIQKIMTEVRSLAERPDWNPFVFRKFLQLVPIIGTEADKKWVIVKVAYAIEHHLDDVTFNTLMPVLEIIDASYLLFETRGVLTEELKVLLPVIPKWLMRYNNSYVRSRYLTIVNKENNDQINVQAAQSSEQWLNQTPLEQIDIVVFTGYCQLLIRTNPGRTQLMTMMKIAEYLLAEYVNDVHIRSIFALLLAKKSTLLRDEMQTMAIRFALQFNEWLSDHNNDTWGRGNLLKLTQVLNNDDLRQRVITALTYWYQQVPRSAEDDITLTEFIVVLLLKPVTPQIDTAIQTITPFINGSAQTQQIQLFIQLVESHGTATNKQAVAIRFYELLTNNPTDESLLLHYLRIVRTCDDNEIISTALYDKYNWMLIHVTPVIQEAYIRLVKQHPQRIDQRQLIRTVQFWRHRGELNEFLEAELTILLSKN